MVQQTLLSRHIQTSGVHIIFRPAPPSQTSQITKAEEVTDHRLSESTVILTDPTTSVDQSSTVDNTEHDDISNSSADDTVTPSVIHVDDEQLKLCSFNCKNVLIN